MWGVRRVERDDERREGKGKSVGTKSGGGGREEGNRGEGRKGEDGR